MVECQISRETKGTIQLCATAIHFLVLSGPSLMDVMGTSFVLRTAICNIDMILDITTNAIRSCHFSAQVARLSHNLITQ